MKAVLVRSFIAAVLIGLAIGLASAVLSVHRATRYEPPLGEAEMQRMRTLPMSEVEAMLRPRRIEMSRWEWLKDSIHYAYFWKGIALRSIAPSCGVFIACIWVGWMEQRRLHQRIGVRP